MVNPYLSNYLDKYGRVYEIPRNRAINLDPGEIVSLMNSPIRFKINPVDYGYSTLEDLYEQAYFDVRFEVKIKGVLNDDIIGKERTKVFISNANISSPTYEELNKLDGLKPKIKPGFISIKKDDYNFGIYFSFNPIN